MIANRSEHDDLRFHWWIQYHLHRQFSEAADHARRHGIALKGDLPIGVSPHSVETWSRPALFHHGTQAGAPPDAFAVRGQNWGFPTYDWEAMAADGFAWWRDRFRAMAAYVDAYRIDHVLGFFRIWEVPPEVDRRAAGPVPTLPAPLSGRGDRRPRRPRPGTAARPSGRYRPTCGRVRRGGADAPGAVLHRSRTTTSASSTPPRSHWPKRSTPAGSTASPAPERAGVKRQLLDLAADVAAAAGRRWLPTPHLLGRHRAVPPAVPRPAAAGRSHGRGLLPSPSRPPVGGRTGGPRSPP